ILEIFKNEFPELKTHLSSYSFNDTETLKAMKDVYSQSGYMLDPHGAVGYLGLKEFLTDKTDFQGIFLETAHPVKFADTVERAIGFKQEIPEKLQNIMKKEKRKILIKDYKELKEFLMH